SATAASTEPASSPASCRASRNGGAHQAGPTHPPHPPTKPGGAGTPPPKGSRDGQGGGGPPPPPPPGGRGPPPAAPRPPPPPPPAPRRQHRLVTHPGPPQRRRDIARIAGPGPLLGPRHQGGADRVEVDVAADGPVVGLVLDHLGLVAALEQMPGAAPPPRRP